MADNSFVSSGFPGNPKINIPNSKNSNSKDNTNDAFEELISNLTNMFGGDGTITINEKDENDEEDILMPLFTDIKYTRPELFKSIGCIKNENLADDFIRKFGEDGSKCTEPNNELPIRVTTELTSSLSLTKEDLSNLELVVTTPEYLIFYIPSMVESEFGFFICVFETPEKTFEAFIPEMANTFKVSEDGKTASRYDCDKDKCGLPDVLLGASTPGDVSDAIDEDEDLKDIVDNIETGVRLLLCPITNTLLSPREFGTITNIKSNKSNDVTLNGHTLLQVGNIYPNKSEKSNMFIKDIDFDDKELYPFYLDLGPNVVLDRDVSREPLSNILFKVDFNSENCLFSKNTELKYTNNGELYASLEDIFQ